MGLTEDLKSRLRREGFDLVGVATAGASATVDHLRAWLEAGLHGGMGWMEGSAGVRSDPRALLPGCRSVVAVAMSYRTAHPPSRQERHDPGNRVWISRYAWGRDYHKIIKRRLVRAGSWLADQRPGAAWRACVDTAPLLEREWAARAGLGWIGKNTSLLNRELGSELFLGFLLTDLELDADGAATEHCGRCTACLDSCPTQAFPRPRVLDATRCIAYLTVEHRGPLAAELQPQMDDMVAGCDICQEVCPWTMRAPAGLHPEYEPAQHRYWPKLDDLEALDEDGYRLWRQGSALNRMSFEQFQRNLRIARSNAEGSRGPGVGGREPGAGGRGPAE
jgi:epoxyqueuosine reductase